MINKILIVTIFFSLCCFSIAKTPDAIFKGKTKLENPLDLRDPFKATLSAIPKEKKIKLDSLELKRDGVYTNIAPTAAIELSTLKVVGILVGKERRAMCISGTSTEIVVLKEGMKIGPQSAELKAILPGGIVLVEKIVNVYGQEEYLETVIPISK
jgi:hypothetical protein